MENELKKDNKMYMKRLDKEQPIMSEAYKIIMQNLEVLNELYKEVERLKSKVDRLGELDVIKDNDIKELKGRVEKLEKSYIPTEEEQLMILDEITAEPIQEKWIVHRTLRTKGIEVYVVERKFANYSVISISKDITYFTSHIKDNAIEFKDLHSATFVRDKLNETRKGKQYLWVISKVEE